MQLIKAHADAKNAEFIMFVPVLGSLLSVIAVQASQLRKGKYANKILQENECLKGKSHLVLY